MKREGLAYEHMSFASRDPVFVELGPLAHTCPVGAGWQLRAPPPRKGPSPVDPRHCQSVGVNSDPSGYWVNVGLYIWNLITHQSRVAAASCFIRKYCANQGLSAPATTERGTRSTQAWSLWDPKLTEVHRGDHMKSTKRQHQFWWRPEGHKEARKKRQFCDIEPLSVDS